MKNSIRILVVSLMVLGLSLTTGCNKKKSATNATKAAPAADKKAAAPAADKKAAAPAAGKKAAAPAADKKVAAPTGDLAAKCGQATDNILKIMTAEMTKRGAPKEVIEKIATDKAKISAKCVEQTKGQPNGAALLDCMIAAKDTNGMRECSVKHPAAPKAPAANQGNAKGPETPKPAGNAGPGKDPVAAPAAKGAAVKATDIKKAVEAIKKGAAAKGAPVNAEAIKKAAEAIKKAAPATK